MKCEVLVVGADRAAALASQLQRLDVDVRLTEPRVEIRSLRQDDDSIAATLVDSDGEEVAVETGFLVREGGTDRDGRVFSVSDPEDVRNLGWKLAYVVRGAGEVLLDSYLPERTARHYRGSPLSQELGGKRARIRAGDEIPDIVLWDNVTETEVPLLELVRGPAWTVLGLGSLTAEVVQSVAVKLDDRVRTHVIGGGASRAPGVTLMDRFGHANRRLSKRGGGVLVVRPDGYLGLRSAANADVIAAYLEDLVPSR